MALLEIADVGFGYSNTALFGDVSFRLNAGERAALVAPNGAGKSTLLRLLAGEIAPDKGSILVRENARVGYYRQSHELADSGSVREALLAGFGELLAARRDLAEAELLAESGAREALERLARANDRYQRAGAHALEHRVETIATRLGFRPQDLERDVATLSGGERGRLRLGAVLASEPELLLLDEPTNHLDLETIRWLEGHLTASPSAILVVSHDRAFLDNTCPTTLELGRSALRSYALGYSEYQRARAADLERETRQAEEQATFVAKTEDFIRRNMAGQKTKQAQSRRKMLDKLERAPRPEDVWARAERVRFRFADAPRSGDIVLEATGLGAARGGTRLLGDLDLLLRRGDRIGIIGPNGSGKSTLLKLLGGRGQSDDAGRVRRGTNLFEGYFDQHLGSLVPERTGVEEIRAVRGDLNVDGARQYLARFRFTGDDPLRKVASLSGGECTRLALAKLLLEPRNLLFLDEPTNHLDIPATEILEEALVGFPGTVLFVSHDRRFLETVSTRTIALHEGQSDVYDGGFLDYCEALERQRSAEQAAAAEQATARQRKASPADDAAQAHRVRVRAVRELERKQRRLGELESAIAARETDHARLQADLKQAGSDDWERLHELAEAERALSRRIEELTAEWVKLSDELAEPRAG